MKNVKRKLIVNKDKTFVFIDASNIIYGCKSAGWRVDFGKLIKFLQTRYGAVKVLYYAGLDVENVKQIAFHELLVKFGYDLRLVLMKRFKNGKKKADVDSRVTFEIMKYLSDYDRSIVLTGDGDFYWVLEYLLQIKKEVRLIGHRQNTARELKQLFGSYFIDLNDIRKIIEYKPQK